jgi:MFS family permease
MKSNNQTKVMGKHKIIFYSSFGGMLEFYDFCVFALLSVYLAKNFFTGDSRSLGLLYTFLVFALGYAARPIGGIIFGHIGDRIGRKKTFIMTIFLMGISTILIGCIPTYASIGITATVLLVILRALQGISVGGELPGGITYVSETFSKRNGYSCGMLYGFVNFGIVLGTGVILLTNLVFSNSEMLSFGWRIPFLIGGFINIIAFFIRRKFTETPVFKELEKKSRVPLLEVFKKYKRAFIFATLIAGFQAAFSNLLIFFIPTFIISYANYNADHVMFMLSIASLIAGVEIIVVGMISDFGFKKINMLLIGALIPFVIGYFIFFMLFTHFTYGWVPMILASLIVCYVVGIVPALLGEVFPVEVRYTGVAFSYSLGYAIFGGFLPALTMWLYTITNSMYAPMISLCAVGCLGLICFFIYPHKNYLKEK